MKKSGPTTVEKSAMKKAPAFCPSVSSCSSATLPKSMKQAAARLRDQQGRKEELLSSSSSIDPKKVASEFRALTQAKTLSKEELRLWDKNPEHLSYCALCYGDFKEDADCCGQEERGEAGDGVTGEKNPVVRLKCGCVYHEACIIPLFEEKQRTYLVCPICEATFGVRRGDMPDGTMAVAALPKNVLRCSGHPDVGTLEIRYSFPLSGKGPKGRKFTAYNFPRVAYVPHTLEGEKVVRMLKVAFQRRLTFTVRDSMTTGEKNAVCWNDIHHRTNHCSAGSFGWPDPTYFNRVSEELASKGVTEKDILGDTSPVGGMVRPSN